jgi:hypothetical protein
MKVESEIPGSAAGLPQVARSGVTFGSAFPPVLAQAISAPGGGKVALVIGAGCSFEPPTSIPLASTCAEEAHRSLVRTGVLTLGECSDTGDLSKVADAVHAKFGTQAQLVDWLLGEYSFKNAMPNSGYLVAAALLREGALSAVVTLNFDLAISHAVSRVGAGTQVGVIDGPHELGRQVSANVYYLHRNANASNPDEWILRTTQLEDGWRQGWEGVIAAKIMPLPVVVFAGLGSPASVLVESVHWIKDRLGTGAAFFQVDPLPRETCAFFQTLKLAMEQYIQLGWCDFANVLGRHVSTRHVDEIMSACAKFVALNKLPTENLDHVRDQFTSLDLVDLGHFRAACELDAGGYRTQKDTNLGLLGDLIHCLAHVERARGLKVVLFPDGTVEFRRAEHVVARFLLVSGGGTWRLPALEPTVRQIAEAHKQRKRLPFNGAIAAGVISAPTSAAPPEDIVHGEPDGSVIDGEAFTIYLTDALRSTPSLVQG